MIGKPAAQSSNDWNFCFYNLPMFILTGNENSGKPGEQ